MTETIATIRLDGRQGGYVPPKTLTIDAKLKLHKG
jgi:hypothetical protein